MEINSLVESLRLDVQPGSITVYDLNEHLGRLALACKELNLNYDFSESNIIEAIQKFFDSENLILSNCIPSKEEKKVFKLRLICGSQQGSRIEFEPYTKDLQKIYKIKLLNKKEFNINAEDPKWRYKFLPKEDLSQYFLRYSCDELIWMNNKEQICEGSFTNIFIKTSSGAWITPSLQCNLLAGIMRKKLIEELKATEGFIYAKDLENAQEILLSNALLGFVNGELIS